MLDQFCSEKDIEICGIFYSDILKTKYLILTCYRSPNGNFKIFCDNITNTLDFLAKPNLQIILTGDFNIDPIRDVSQYKILNNILATYNIKNIINKPTRDKYSLDHIYAKKSSPFSVIDNYISDHRIILFKFIKTDISNRIIKKSLRRNYSEKNIDNFCEDLQKETWT